MPDRAKLCIDILLKFSQLQESIDNINNLDSIHAMSANADTADTRQKQPVNIEALLRDIRPACNSQEAKYIDMFLNLSKSRDILGTYRAMNYDFSTDDIFKSYDEGVNSNATRHQSW